MNQYRFRILWIALLMLGLFFPFIRFFQLTGLSFVLNILTTLILASSIHALSDNRRNLFLGTVLIAPVIVLSWLNYFRPVQPLQLVTTIFQALAMSFVAFHILRFALQTGRVDAQKIDAAVCVYLLIGVIWQDFFILAHKFIPGSFDNPLLTDSDFLYFSFITLSTLGYGDITPVSEPAQALAYTEAILGQLYLTILVARLVGLYIAYAGVECSDDG